MANKETRVAKRPKQDKEFVYKYDGSKHEISGSGDIADALAVAASTIIAFGIGFILARRS